MKTIFSLDQTSHWIAMAHQWIPFCTTTPLQVAVASCFKHALNSSYFEDLKSTLVTNKNVLLEGLRSEFNCVEPQGGYFIVATPKEKLYKKLEASLQLQGRASDSDLAKQLITNHGIGSIPMSAFYSADLPKNPFLRFAYCKEEALIRQGIDKLSGLASS